MSDDRPLIDVVCAVIQRANGEFLLAQRPTGKVYQGYWEFPGGKVEPSESFAQATARELFEELGIVVKESFPWLTRKFSYPHAQVRLHFRRVTRWENEPLGRERQALAWQRLGNVFVSPLLPANGPILVALELPDIYGISNAEFFGEHEMLRRMERAFIRGLRLAQVREKNWPQERVAKFAGEAIRLARQFGAKVLINSTEQLAFELGADGVHLTASQLMAATQKPNVPLCAASCHNQEELRKAELLGLDFVVLGPILPTPTHAESEPLGWDRFAKLAEDRPLPIFGLGGLAPEHQSLARQCGAHGIAMLRHAWLD